MKLNQLRYQDPKTKAYLSSPSITRLLAGDLLATHDYFGPGCPLNHEDEEHLLSVYRSGDDGETWENITHIAGAFWSNLFVHMGKVYLLGASQQYGNIVIRRSDDGGFTWTHPRDSRSGLLFKGGPYREPPNYHCGSMPVLKAGGRLYRAFEDLVTNERGENVYRSFVVSAGEEEDLLDASSWAMSNKLDLDTTSAPKEWHTPNDLIWREGNVVQAPNGEIWNILRVNPQQEVDMAAVTKVHEEGRRVSFDPETGFIEFPGGGSKFTIRRDETTGAYWTLSNGNNNPAFRTRRSVLSLYQSNDLVNWRHRATLLQNDSGLSSEEAVRLTGFQYVDWQYDREDIIYLVRMAYNGAPNYHDSNRITFHRVTNFRELSD